MNFIFNYFKAKYICSARLCAVCFLNYILLVGITAQNTKESDFYTETNHLGVVKNFVNDYGGNGNDALDDSEKLQEAIDELSSLKNGGKIIFPSGTYYLAEIQLRSNVHLVIDRETTIIPVQRQNQKNYKIFQLDGQNEIIKNVSIRGVGGAFKVDLRNLKNKNVGVFSCGNVENFLIANFHVLDDYTKFSAVTFGVSAFKGGYNYASRGVIKNASIKNANYGYGLIQTQAARDILFENISGSGGVTLRFETGYDKMNKLQVGGVFNMVARNVSCENGNAALMISPHSMHNGSVNVDGVYAKNCGFAVRIEKGYVKKGLKSLNLVPGIYEPSEVKNVTAIYGNSAQLKSKHFKYMRCHLRNLITVDANHTLEKIYSGPSIAAVLNGAEGEGKGKFLVKVSNVSSSGFTEDQKDILYEEDTYLCSEN
ncbi:glycosyl hydrolase family 28-related protein [Saccharicrinis fermentans]|uniref:Iota-carrageenase n=1 Tax=Saccharicrinis fermentans DSM 9555 = JCM 21142 TaxID=869213 RepID=W7YCG0_9BACT|nr:glycosyl hydrolase family 28-related protein [Saccharicrinis fermentans]GAF02136.1 iota-carrageenase precursor [Saccharicrinis fermentans DSM 9555 = JCM 21142]